MKRLTFSFMFVFLVSSEAFAACQWGYVNALVIDITQAQGFLSKYSTCRGDCRALENKLNQSVTKMSQSSACGAHIYTRGNKDMINFIAGRFRLIQKQKQGSTWTAQATGKSVTAPVNRSANVPLVMDKPAFVEPQGLVAPQTVSAQEERVMPSKQQPSVQQPESVAVVTPYTEPKSPEPAPQMTSRADPQTQRAVQTRMTLSQEAYSALWNDEAKPRARAPQRNVRRAVVRRPQVNHNAKRKLLAQQRLHQKRKQLLIHQNQMRLVKAKQRAMHNHLQQQRLRQQRLLKRREVARQVNRVRAQQRKAVMAQRRR